MSYGNERDFFFFFLKKALKILGNIEIQKSNGVKFMCSLTMMELIYIKKYNAASQTLTVCSFCHLFSSLTNNNIIVVRKENF